MAADGNGSLYIAGPAFTTAGQPVPVRTPPGGPYWLAPDPSTARGYIARVRPEGDVVFWVAMVPMTVRDLKLDPQGGLWAAGVATRSQSSGDVVPCFSSNTPTLDSDASSNTTPAALRLSADGRSAPIFQCVGRGWQVTSADSLTARLGFDGGGSIYLAGSAAAYQGFASTDGAAMASPAAASVPNAVLGAPT